MKKTNGFALAVVILLLVPGCKPDTPAPQPEKAPAVVKESLTDMRSDAGPSTPEPPPPQPEEAPAEAKESLEGTQSEVDPSAKEAADKFLEAMKSIDSPESKKTLAETRWRKTMKFPEYQEIKLLSEEMFSSDIPGVKGYKQVTSLRIPREGGRPVVKRYMLVAYEDTKKKTWKIFDFTEVADPDQEAEKSCEEKSLAEGATTTRQGRLMRCSYWRMMAGEVDKANEMAKKANELYEKNPDPDDEARHYKARADATIDMITRMSGEHT